MTHAQHAPHTPPAGSAPSDNTHWTPDKAAIFLKTLARVGKVAPAAASVGMSRQAAYRLKRRAPKFAEMWDIAMEEAERLRLAATRRKKPVSPLLAKCPLDPAPSASQQGYTLGQFR